MESISSWTELCAWRFCTGDVCGGPADNADEAVNVAASDMTASRGRKARMTALLCPGRDSETFETTTMLVRNIVLARFQ
jgi:hypothetical protein